MNQSITSVRLYGAAIAAFVVNVMFGAVEFPQLRSFNQTWRSGELGTSYDRALPTAVLLGNASLGVVNGGDATCKRFVLTRGDLWSCGSLTNLISKERGTDPANEITIISFADLEIIPPEGAIDYSDELDIQTASLITRGTFGGDAVKLSTWVAADADILVITGVSERDAVWKLRLKCHNEKPVFPTESGVMNSNIWIKRSTLDNTGGDPRGWTTNATAAVCVIGVETLRAQTIDRLSAEQEIRVLANKPFTIAVGAGIGFTIDAEGAEKLRTRHLQWWENWWGRSRIAIGDHVIEKYWYGSLYLLGSAVRDGKLPPGLYAHWVTTDKALWNNDFHLNYNYIAPYYGCFAANHAEIAFPMPDPLIAYLPRAERNARLWLRELDKPDNEYVKSRKDLVDGIPDAALFPVGLGPWGVSSEGDKQYWKQTLNGAFQAALACTTWEYTLDEDYLLKTWPFLDRVANFYLKWCEREELGDGRHRYIVYDSLNEGGGVVKNCMPTLGCIRHLFKTLVAVTPTLKKLGITVTDAKFAAWKDFAENLSELPRGIYKRQGVECHAFSMIEFDDGRALCAMGGNCFDFEAIIPGEEFTFDLSPEMRKLADASWAAKLTADPKSIWGSKNGTSKIFATMIRCGCPPAPIIAAFKEYELGRAWQKNFTLPDGFHGIEKVGGIEFINSMLIQCDHGYVKIFPNWIGADAKFDSLRAKGCFTVSSEMKDGKVLFVEVKSEKGGTFRLVDPFGGACRSTVSRHGQTRNSGEPTLELDMKPGERIRLVPRDSL